MTTSPKSSEKRPFAAFDIDGTLIRWQLFHSVTTKLAQDGKLSPTAAETIKTAQREWKIRLSQESYDTYNHTLVHEHEDNLAQLSPADFRAAIDDVFEKYKDQTHTFTRNLIRELKANGYFLLAISGSPVEIVAKIAEYYGFDNFYGSIHILENGAFSGIDTDVRSKNLPLAKLIEKHHLASAGSVAVGDTENDIAMLEMAERPIAFNPTKKLFEYAREQGWEIVVERKNMVYKLESRNGTYLLAETGE
jgi:HAD superfamily hydrolase (TIGR01490 family)